MSAGLSGNNTGTTQQFSGEESAEFMVMQPDAWFSFIFSNIYSFVLPEFPAQGHTVQIDIVCPLTAH